MSPFCGLKLANRGLNHGLQTATRPVVMRFAATFFIYICMYICMYVCVCVCVYVCLCVCMYSCMYVCVYICMRVCMYSFKYVLMYVCMDETAQVSVLLCVNRSVCVPVPYCYRTCAIAKSGFRSGIFCSPIGSPSWANLYVEIFPAIASYSLICGSVVRLCYSRKFYQYRCQLPDDCS